ncbi:MAG: DNA polymerase III subunit gamma/tau [Hyphomonadaceae bacterium]
MNDSDDMTADEGPDDQTFSMFGDAEMGTPKAGYEVLARKYRPRLFDDLIGQEAMVRTLSNAFETGRVAHAFMLTGVRGVGKTTTARLLARGLNYVREGADGPSIQLDPAGEHCAAIMESRHPDVLELDAASRTGVADMRDLLDGVRYSPVSARYKVYIIDEVHMLSTAAFNALLKTLEEPPAHVKFIFATTEIRKVPVTVLSRCQRFDLKRLAPIELAEHLGRVSKSEGVSVSDEGLALIARAAEGSVRDALSILDQALVQMTDGEAVSEIAVRDMLGLADRGRLFDVLEKALTGQAKEAALETASQIHDGADPLVILKDLLDITADIAMAQVTGEDYRSAGPAEWTDRTRALAQRLTSAQAARYWQILLSGYQDTQLAPDLGVAAQMVVLRLAAAAQLPSPEEAARMLSQSGGDAAGNGGKPDAAGVDPARSGGPTSFTEIVALLDAHKEAILSGLVSDYIRPVSCTALCLVCDMKDGAPPDLLRRLADFLIEATDEDWDVLRSDEKADTETLKERRVRVRDEKMTSAGAHPSVKEALALFEGAELVDVHNESRDDQNSNVVALEPKMAAKG